MMFGMTIPEVVGRTAMGGAIVTGAVAGVPVEGCDGDGDGVSVVGPSGEPRVNGAGV
jgi:hypothetical protein